MDPSPYAVPLADLEATARVAPSDQGTAQALVEPPQGRWDGLLVDPGAGGGGGGDVDGE